VEDLVAGVEARLALERDGPEDAAGSVVEHDDLRGPIFVDRPES
jgi:hypothetical protein